MRRHGIHAIATGVATLFVSSIGWAQAPCACDCDVDGNGVCDFPTDGLTVLSCVGMYPIGGCANADINCDGAIDVFDVDAFTCGFGGGTPDLCCQPLANVFFDYQGELSFAGTPVTGVCDFEFTLWDDPVTPPGVAVGLTQTINNVSVTNGLFDVTLSFGRAAFDGETRWMAIAVVCPSGGTGVLLSPRQEINPTPYAVRALTGVGGPNGLLVDNRDQVGIGLSDPQDIVGKLHVADTSTVAIFDRQVTDGTIIDLHRDALSVGSISVAAGVVSYNPFTGSHLAWTDRPLEVGTLVVLTGVNRRLHAQEDSEIVYGVAPSMRANDSRCLGSYLSSREPSSPHGQADAHHVMAVGNGLMWVVDSGRNVEPGQYLISSDVAGHAMLDDPLRFTLGNVIARASEPIDWDTVSESVDGRKHKRISVLFESFERGSAASVTSLVERQQHEIDALAARLEALEPVQRGTGVRAGLPLAVAVMFGLIALRRRSRGGGAR